MVFLSFIKIISCKNIYSKLTTKVRLLNKAHPYHPDTKRLFGHTQQLTHLAKTRIGFAAVYRA